MNWKFTLAIMVSFALMMSSSYTMLIPFLPIYLETELGADADSVNLWSGAAFAITFAISAFVSPLWGKLSDNMGKKPMVIRSSILLAVTYFLGGIVSSPLELFLVRAFQGIASGLWPACLVLLSAVIPKNKIGLSMGLMQSANICGGILGPLLGGLLATGFGMRNSFFIGSAILATISLITVFFIKEPPAIEEKGNGVKAQKASSLSLLKDSNVFILLLCVCLTNMVILQIQPIVALYVKELTGNTGNVILLSGMVLSLGGFAGAIASPIWGRSGQKIGFCKTMTAALIAAGLMIALQSLPNELYLFAIAQFLCGLGFSGIFPSANSILILFTPPSSRGAGFGLLFSAQMVGGAIGPILGGVVATCLKFSTVYVFSGAILFFLGLYLLFLAPKKFKDVANQVKSAEAPVSDNFEEIKRQALAEVRAENLAKERKHDKSPLKRLEETDNRDLPVI